MRASSVPPPRELPTAPLIQRQRRGSIAPGAPASNVSSRLREREAEFARQVRHAQSMNRFVNATSFHLLY